MVRTKYHMYVVNNRPQFPNQGPADSNRSPSYEDLKTVRDEGKLTAAQVDVFMTPRPHEELFDCLEDPEQLNNVASTPKYAPVLEDLRAVMARWIAETGDDVPEHLTKAAFDSETGERLPGVNGNNTIERGEMPGSSKNAVSINNKGPY
jgi:hypothetical protein